MDRASTPRRTYYCSHCRNYYYFRCRARLLGADKQYQCVNQDCEYYRKLVCGVCDPEVQRDEPPAVYLEPEDGYWPALLVVSLILAVLTWVTSSFSAGLLMLLVAFAGGALRRLAIE